MIRTFAFFLVCLSIAQAGGAKNAMDVVYAERGNRKLKLDLHYV